MTMLPSQAPAGEGRCHVLLGVIALALAIMAGLLSARQNTLYLQQHAYYGDTATYTAVNFQAGFTARRAGRWPAIAEQLTTNQVNPFRTIPVLAVAPSLLLTPNGHLPTATFMLFCFLLLLAALLYQRTASLAYAIAGMLMVISAERFFDPVNGMAACYPDLHSAYLMGAALCALLISDEGRRLPWLALFGVFASWVALSRWVAAGYCLVVCGPVLAFFLVKQWLVDSRKWRGLGLRLLAVAGPILFFAGYFLIRFSGKNFEHYHALGYGLGLPFQESMHNVNWVIRDYFGRAGLCFLGALLATYCGLHWSRRVSISEVLVSVWLGAAFFLFYVFVMRVAGDPTTPYYMLPGLYVLGLAPFTVPRHASQPTKHAASRRTWLVAALASVVALALAATGYAGTLSRRATSSDYAQKEHRFMLELSRHLGDAALKYVGANRLPTFDTFLSPYGRSILVETAVLSGTELQWHQIFNKHDVVWKHVFEGVNQADIPARAYAALRDNCDFVAILRAPENTVAAPLFMNDLGDMNAIPVPVIQYANRWLTAPDASWQKLREIESPWGAVDLYVNTLRCPAK